MVLIKSTGISVPPVTSIAFSEARSPPTCRCRSRPSTNWSSISRPPRPSASTFHRPCSPAPTKSSNDRKQFPLTMLHRAAQAAYPRRRGDRVRRREFITILGGATAWPLVVGAQEAAMPVVAFVSPSERDSLPPRYVAAFRKGLSDTGYIEGQNV